MASGDFEDWSASSASCHRTPGYVGLGGGRLTWIGSESTDWTRVHPEWRWALRCVTVLCISCQCGRLRVGSFVQLSSFRREVRRDHGWRHRRRDLEMKSQRPAAIRSTIPAFILMRNPISRDDSFYSKDSLAKASAAPFTWEEAACFSKLTTNWAKVPPPLAGALKRSSSRDWSSDGIGPSAIARPWRATDMEKVAICEQLISSP